MLKLSRRIGKLKPIGVRGISQSAIPSDFPTAPRLLPLPLPDSEATILQNNLLYNFSNRILLEDAITHTSYPNRGRSSLTDPPSLRSYKSLFPVAEHALNELTFHLECSLKDKKEECKLLCNANLAPHKLARIAIRLRLYDFLRRDSPKMDQKVEEFINEQEGKVPYRGIPLKVPTVLTDLVSVVFGAVKADCNKRNADCWQVDCWQSIRRHFEPIIYWENMEQSFGALCEVCNDHEMRLDFKRKRECKLITTKVFINNILHGSGTSEVEAISNFSAAMDALNKLPSYMLTGTMLDTLLDGRGEDLAVLPPIDDSI